MPNINLADMNLADMNRCTHLFKFQKIFYEYRGMNIVACLRAVFFHFNIRTENGRVLSADCPS